MKWLRVPFAALALVASLGIAGCGPEEGAPERDVDVDVREDLPAGENVDVDIKGDEAGGGAE